MQKLTREEFKESIRELKKEETDVVDCPIWPNADARTFKLGDIEKSQEFWSPRAGGVFTIPRKCLKLNQIQFPDNAVRQKVSSWIWERNAAFERLPAHKEEELPELTPDLVKELKSRKPLPVETRIDHALRAIGKPPKGLSLNLTGSVSDVHGIFMAATECGDRTEMMWLLQQLRDAGLIAVGEGTARYMLSLKGLDRLETGGDAVVSKTAFVAMWFDREVDDAYENGLEPAIRDAGYEPIRIDMTEHVERIDDRIVAEIRRARFLVCDFTCGILPDTGSGQSAVARGGVYYEAGLAHGLGKPVIWTCRKDLLNHVHFDIRQYNFILWETGKEGALREALLRRIQAVIA